MGLRRLMTWIGLGAGLMYFYDPEQGNRRRALMRDQWTSTRNDFQDFWSKAQRDLSNRAQGVKQDPSALGDMVGQAARTQGEWSPGVRLVATLAGGGLTFYGLASRGIKGTAATLFGLNLVTRGVANKGLRSVLGMDGQSATMDAHKTFMIDAPANEVFAFWRNYDNFPRFMNHVREVRDMGQGRSHWVVEGPAGTPFEWDAVMTDLQPDRLIAWESLPSAEVPNGGRVQFEKQNQGTRVTIRMWYKPPAGPLGHAFASLFGSDPQTALDDDMLRFKSLLEQGKTSAGGKQVSREEVAPSSVKSGQDMSSGRQTNSQSGQPSSGGQSSQSGSMGQGKSQGGSSVNPPKAQKPDLKADSGMPGGGAGRIDRVGGSGVYPASAADEAPADAELQGMASFGQADLGAEGYHESGRSELSGLEDANLGDEVEDDESDSGNFDSLLPGNPSGGTL